jgi:serine phosphatase RsbU (regulator of sigma subunit)
MNPSDVSVITLMGAGDVLFLYTDGVYDGTDQESRQAIERIIRQAKHAPAKEICNAILNYALEQDGRLRAGGESDRIDDKTVFIIKRT